MHVHYSSHNRNVAFTVKSTMLKSLASLHSPNAGGVRVCRPLCMHMCVYTCPLYILSRALHNVLGSSVIISDCALCYCITVNNTFVRSSCVLRVAIARSVGEHNGYLEGFPSGHTLRLSTGYQPALPYNVRFNTRLECGGL